MGYMPQDLFDGCALTIAMAKFAGVDSRAAARKLADDYTRGYEDVMLFEDFIQASDRIVKFMKDTFQSAPDAGLASSCTTMAKVIAKYHSDGSKRRKRRLFGGTFFQKERSQISNKVGNCMKDIVLYHALIITGTIDPSTVYR